MAASEHCARMASKREQTQANTSKQSQQTQARLSIISNSACSMQQVCGVMSKVLECRKRNNKATPHEQRNCRNFAVIKRWTSV